jgi:predicted nucleic acid-binding protein
VEVKVALDTNRLPDLFRSDAELAERLGGCKEVWIPLIVLGEIRAGFYAGTQRQRNEILLNELLAKPTVGVLLPDSETAEHYARLWVQLRRAQSDP